MRAHPDRTHAGAAAAVRDAERLVQVQVAHIGTDLARLHQPDHGVEVRPVQIDLPAVGMGDVADLSDGLLEHAMGRGVGYHAGRQSVPGGRGLGAEILHVDVAAGGAVHHDHLHAGHLRAGRVGPVGVHRNQTYVPVARAIGLVEGADGQQPGVFPLSARVRLHRHGVIAGDRAEPLRQVADQLRVARRLVGRGERMDIGELGPGYGGHFGGRVQLHGAGAQRDHRPVQRQVPVRQTAHVAHHLGLGAVHVEHRMGQVVAFAHQLLGDPIARLTAVGAAEHLQQAAHGQIPRGLVQGDAQPGRADAPQVDAPVGGGLEYDLPQGAAVHGDGVEKRLRSHIIARGLQRRGHARGLEMDALGDRLEPVRTVEHGVESRHDRQQCLGGTDVAGRLLAPDMLLAGLQAQPVGLVAPRVDGHAHDPPRHRPLHGVPARHVGGMGPAIAHRYAEALRRAHGDIRPHGARFLEQRQRQRIGDHDTHGVRVMQVGDQVRHVAQPAVRARILEHAGKDLPRRHVVGRADHDLQAQGRASCADHRDVLGMAALVHEHRPRLRFRHPLGHRDGLGGRRRLVQQRGVGDLQPGQVRHHGLEVQQRLQPALADLRLIGRIGRVPGRVLQNVALDRRRRDGAVKPLTDHRREHRILPRDLSKLP
ncbi:hypothetical protein PARU111607_17590 [Palleronia rufa]